MIDITFGSGNGRRSWLVDMTMSLRTAIAFRRQQRLVSRALATAPTPASRAELRVLLNPR